MSHFDALSRLTVADRRIDMIRWVFHGAVDRVERAWNSDASPTRDMIDLNPRVAWLGSHVASLLATAALVGGVGVASPAAAQVSDELWAVSAYNLLTPERTGGLAVARSARRVSTDHGRCGAIVALVLGPIGLVLGGLVVATADGGLGTGNGLGGGIVAMLAGMIGIALGGLALARSHRTA
jgi:hypothetical protein